MEYSGHINCYRSADRLTPKAKLELSEDTVPRMVLHMQDYLM